MTVVDCPFCGDISVPGSGAAAWVNGAVRCIALIPCTSKR